MNRRTKFLVFASMVALLVAAVILWLRPMPPGRGATSNATSEQPTSSPHPAVRSGHSPKSRQIDGNKFGGLGTLSAVPVEFYGKVIDQNGRPLAGVEVTGGTGSATGFMQQETRTYTTAAKARGQRLSGKAVDRGLRMGDRFNHEVWTVQGGAGGQGGLLRRLRRGDLRE